MPAQRIYGIVSKAGVMAKTVTMTVEKNMVHPKLLKPFVRHKKYLVHDPLEQLSVGDMIKAQACRPLSARKRFTLAQIMGRKEEGAERRAVAARMMSAEDKEKLRIEQRVKTELANANRSPSDKQQAKSSSAAAAARQ